MQARVGRQPNSVLACMQLSVVSICNDITVLHKSNKKHIHLRIVVLDLFIQARIKNSTHIFHGHLPLNIDNQTKGNAN